MRQTNEESLGMGYSLPVCWLRYLCFTYQVHRFENRRGENSNLMHSLTILEVVPLTGSQEDMDVAQHHAKTQQENVVEEIEDDLVDVNVLNSIGKLNSLKLLTKKLS